MSFLQGKTALVTGSTSGIGLGVAIELAKQGAHIVMNGFGDVDAPRKQIEATGAKVEYHGADMSKAGEIEDMMKFATSACGWGQPPECPPGTALRLTFTNEIDARICPAHSRQCCARPPANRS